MTQRVDVSVVVCTYNRMDMLQLALSSLLTQETRDTFSYEIVVIDDGSTDGTANVVKETSRNSSVPLRYFREEGGGVARARNRAVNEAQGAWIAFFDDDQLATPNWLIELWGAANRTGADCVGGARLLRLPEAEMARLHSITRAFLGEMLVHEEREKTERRWFPNTGNSLVSRATFQRIGGFDDAKKYGGEDLDFFRKVRMARLKVWETPNAIVYHLVPPYRVERKYLQWTAMRSGIAFAELDRLETGLSKTILMCSARLLQAALLAFPGIMWGLLRRDDSVVLGRTCQMAKAKGYALKVLSMALPSISREVKILDKMQFRLERDMFDEKK